MNSNTAATTFARSAAPAAALARSRSRKKRFLIVSIAALAVMAVTMGVSFLGQSGSTSLSVSAGSGSTSLVWTPGSSSFSLPYHSGSTNSLTTAKYATTITTAATTSASGVVTSVLPSWSPTANSPGAISTAGDLAVIDATQGSGNVIVDVYVTNLAALSKDYSSFAFPINVYWSNGASSGSSTWAVTDGNSGNPSVVTSTAYLTDSSGVISFSLPPGHYYDITMETGGSFYCISTSATGGSLAPSFFVTANATA